MRAVICQRFQAYRFEDVDRLTMSQLMEHYSAAMWLSEEEAKAVKRGQKS